LPFAPFITRKCIRPIVGFALKSGPKAYHGALFCAVKSWFAAILFTELENCVVHEALQHLLKFGIELNFKSFFVN
jgi:hypothetical protein